jgi:predicted HicB family RNase H-like nuclease
MEYNGYTARIEFDDSADVFHGEVLDLRDVITFQGASVEELWQAFRDSVDDYLEFCAERGEEPEKPFSGKFLVRVTPELHRRATVAAAREGESLNSWVASTIQAAVVPESAGPDVRLSRSSQGRAEVR